MKGWHSSRRNEEASGQDKKKMLCWMSVLNQYFIYSDKNDRGKCKVINSELI